MNGENSTIKRNVMRRVYFAHTARKFLQPRVIKLGLLFLFVALQSAFVSLPNVISNLGNPAQSFRGLYAFIVSAFMNTEVTVQLLSVGIAVVGVLFVRDFFRNSRVLAAQLS
jgi:hypothetical protein